MLKELRSYQSNGMNCKIIFVSMSIKDPALIILPYIWNARFTIHWFWIQFWKNLAKITHFMSFYITIKLFRSKQKMYIQKKKLIAPFSKTKETDVNCYWELTSMISSHFRLVYEICREMSQHFILFWCNFLKTIQILGKEK